MDAGETSDVRQAPGGAGDAGRRDGCLRRLATRSDLIEVAGEQDAPRLDPPGCSTGIRGGGSHGMRPTLLPRPADALTAWGPGWPTSSALSRSRDLGPPCSGVDLRAAQRPQSRHGAVRDPGQAGTGSGCGPEVPPPLQPGRTAWSPSTMPPTPRRSGGWLRRETPRFEGHPGTGESEVWLGIRDDAGISSRAARCTGSPPGAAHLAGVLVAVRARRAGAQAGGQCCADPVGGRTGRVSAPSGCMPTTTPPAASITPSAIAPTRSGRAGSWSAFATPPESPAVRVPVERVRPSAPGWEEISPLRVRGRFRVVERRWVSSCVIPCPG